MARRRFPSVLAVRPDLREGRGSAEARAGDATRGRNRRRGAPRVRGDELPLSHHPLRQGLVRAWRTELAGTRFGPAQGSLAVESRRSRPRAPRIPACAVLWPGRRPSLGAGCHPGVPCPTAKVSMGPPLVSMACCEPSITPSLAAPGSPPLQRGGDPELVPPGTWARPTAASMRVGGGCGGSFWVLHAPAAASMNRGPGTGNVSAQMLAPRTQL